MKGSPKPFFFALALIVAGTAAYFLTPFDEVLRVCNASPFDMRYSLLKSEPRGVRVLSQRDGGAYRQLDVGNCATFKIGKPEKGVTYHVRATSELTDPVRHKANKNLIVYAYGLGAESAGIVDWEGEKATFCGDGSNALRFSRARSQACPAGQDAISFVEVRRVGGKNGDLYHFFSAPGMPLVDVTAYDDKKFMLSDIRRKSREMQTVLRRHVAFIAKWSGHQVPLHLGATLVDHNGPLASGVLVKSPAKTSIFGDPLPLSDGDVIYRLNGVDVFSEADIFQALIWHGWDISRGITEPIELVFESGGRLKRQQATYFFNERYFQFAGSRKDDAVYYGLLNAVSLGLAAESNCAAKNAPAFLANRLFDLAELLDDGKKHKRVEYFDFDKCVWNAENEIALAQQKHRDIYTDISWLTIITPNAPRLLFGKAATKGMQKVLGKGAAAAVSGDVALELLETGIFFLNDKSPLQNYGDVAKEYYDALPFMAGIVVTVGIVRSGIS